MDPAYSSVPVPSPEVRRPVGVVLAAVVLGLMTLFWIFGGLISIFGALFIRTPQAAQYPAIEGVQIGMGIVILLLCGMCAWVLVGLFQLKNWARIGILIVGGVVAFYSFVMTAMFCVMAFINLDSFVPAGTSAASPVALRAAFLGMGVVSALFCIVGVWWLVYFNQRRVRALFVISPWGGAIEPVSQAPVAAGGNAMASSGRSAAWLRYW